MGEETVIARYHGGREVSDSDSSWADIDVGEMALFMDVSYFGVTANLSGGKFQPQLCSDRRPDLHLSYVERTGFRHLRRNRNGRPIPGMINKARVSE